MHRAVKFALIALLTFTLLGVAQTASAPPSREPGGTSPTRGTVNPVPQSRLIRILTPVSNEKLANDFTTVRFQLTTPTAYAGIPNYLVQMDGRDPITTSLTQQEFSGLTPGQHTVTVELVDANGVPVRGSRAAVRFFVAPTTAHPTTTKPRGMASAGHRSRELKIAGFTFMRPDPTHQDQEDPNLPPASSPLPLISIIGFGVLVGGIFSALKTRS